MTEEKALAKLQEKDASLNKKLIFKYQDKTNVLCFNLF